MPKQLPGDLLDRVRGHLTDAPEGCALADLEGFLLLRSFFSDSQFHDA